MEKLCASASTPIKLNIAITPDLSESLAAYARLYRDTYGQEEPVVELIPAMLESLRAFVERQRH